VRGGLAAMAWWLAVATAAAAPARDPERYFFHETWGDLREELQRARDEGKKGIMIFFDQKDCPFCFYMKENILNRPAVQEFYRRHFILVRVDIEGDVEITDFDGTTMSQKDFAFRRHRVRATPVIAFFDLEGRRIFRHIGKARDVREFMLMGEYVATGAYGAMSFTRYKRERRKAGGG